MESPTEISGTVDRVVFRNVENGFAVFVIKVSVRETVTVRGYAGDLHQGSQVTLKGNWIFHPKFGRQLELKECAVQAPTSVIGIRKYLSSGLIKGIGPKFAEKLVKRFGEKTLEVIDKTPKELFKVSGVGPKRVEAIISAWQDQKEISQVMVFLRSKDISSTYAVKIFKAYGNQAIDKIQANPYCLIDDIWGIGFKISDQIALKLGLERNSLERVKAGILHGITQATDSGHLYVEIQKLKDVVVKILELEENDDSQVLLKGALTGLYQEKRVKLLSHMDRHYLTLPKFYFSERGIALKVLRLLEAKSCLKEVDLNKVYQQIRGADAQNVILNEDQQRGILSCMQNKVAIITGGPGTGKTTLVKRLIQVMEDQRLRFRLAAPTGRAAKRMFESTGRNAETLHRLLEFTPTTMNFARNEQNALDLDVLIIDEASMIDVFLMHSILRALPSHVSLVLIGDVDQLPSVGAGNVLNDLIASKKISVSYLKQIFRQAQNSMIVINAHRVNRGEFPQRVLPGSKKDFLYVKEDAAENIFPWLKSVYTNRLAKLGIDPNDSVVLVPMNRGIVGTVRLNQELQQILNPVAKEGDGFMKFGNEYYVGDRVMQIRNNYDKFVFNGDIGKIVAIDKENQHLVVRFGARDLEYDWAEMNELVLSYAISIHKSQGSEFPVVIIPIFMQHFILLQRNLIYTAITRAKKLCILVGQTKAIAMGIKNNKGVERLTFLEQFLTTNLEAR